MRVVGLATRPRRACRVIHFPNCPFLLLRSFLKLPIGVGAFQLLIALRVI